MRGKKNLMFNLFEMVRLLSAAKVDLVIVGGIAIRGHGGNYITEDLDICYSRTRDNLKKIAVVLSPLKPRLRGVDNSLPFIFDWTTLQHGTNFTFTTTLGDIDLLGEVKGVGSYDDLLKESLEIDLDGFKTHILSIPSLIVAKEAAGRPKDELGLKVLYALQEAESNED